ncbi:MAG TPA: hypothetical protein VEZ71_24995 [Archangium sp.]|nr:hypothetical protein [Archangium sp.]
MPSSPSSRTSLAVLLLLCVSFAAQAAETTPEAFLATHNTEGVRLNRAAMGVLLGWAVLNIGTGTAGHFTTQGELRAFWQANAAWNVVNLAIGGFGLYGQLTATPETWDLGRSLAEGQKMEKLLLLNAGLDVGYVAFGGFLLERGLRTDSAQLRGWGKSLLLQGGFLLLFDAVLWGLNWRLNSQLTARLVPAPDGVGLLLTWP